MKKIITSFIIMIIFILVGSVVLASTGVTNTDGLNFREEPSTSGKLIDKISKGAKLEIISTEGDWYKITYNGKTGYVSKQYVDNSDDQTTTAIENESVSNITKTTAKTTIYALPLLNSTKIDTIENGEDVKLLSVNGQWAYVSAKNGYGWVFAKNLASTKITLAEVKEEKVEEPVDTNTVEESTNTVNNTVENKVEEKVENKPVENTTTETKTEETTSSVKLPTTMYVKVDAVNIRSKADASSDKVTSAGKNCPVYVTAKEGDWYKVEISDGKGYVKAEFLSTEKQ